MSHTRLQGKIVALVGQFDGNLNKYQLCEMIDRMGAKSRLQFSSRTDILIAGKRAGKALLSAEQAGIEIWTPEQFFEAIQAYNDAVDGAAAEYELSPYQSAFATDSSWSRRIVSVLGLSVLKRTHERVVGDKHAYHLYGRPYDGYDPNLVWMQAGVESLQCLVLDQMTPYMWREFMDHAARMPNLKALAVAQGRNIGGDFPIDVAELLHAFPQLACLHIKGPQITPQFDIGRYSQLQQLVLSSVPVDGLGLVSFPNLHYLGVSVPSERLVYDFPSLASFAQQFPLLRHLSLHGNALVENHLLTDNLPATIDALSLEYENRDALQLSRDVALLVDMQASQQIKHFAVISRTMTELELDVATVLPQLTHLKLQGHVNDVEQLNVTPWVVTSNLHLDLSGCEMNSQCANRLVTNLKQLPPLGHLNLDHNRINAKATVQRLEKLPFPVSIQSQVN